MRRVWRWSHDEFDSETRAALIVCSTMFNDNDDNDSNNFGDNHVNQCALICKLFQRSHGRQYMKYLYTYVHNQLKH